MGMNINSTYLKKREWRLQPTPPYRDEPIGLQLALDMYYFNPHPTCEDNRKSSIVYLVYGDFNSHPLTGMNLCHYIATHQNLLQPTPPYGDELKVILDAKNCTPFQPTPPYGDEQKSNATNCRPRKFQPTPLQGGVNVILPTERKP